ncbi:MAG: GIY-YIG nuclease family protein [Peptostreptococcaceae bacterium]
MCYVYILKCGDNTLYTGWTTNLEKRLKCHNSGKGAKYTRCRLPVEIIYSENLSDKSSALKRECEIKKLSRDKKLLLIEENSVMDYNNLVFSGK